MYDEWKRGKTVAELAFKEYTFKKGSKTTVYMYQNSIEIIQNRFLGKFNKGKLLQFKNISNVTLKEPGFASNGNIVIDCGPGENKKEKHMYCMASFSLLRLVVLSDYSIPKAILKTL